MPPARSILTKLAGPAVVFLVGVAMAIWTWNTWPDVLVDFGKELYIAWRLSAGDHLYRDVAYYMGPLSPAINGLLFSIFGVSLRTLVIANLCVAAGITFLIMHLAKHAAGTAASIIAGLVFVLLFAFSQFTPTGNYNFVCPYEHEYTHGLLISLATLAILHRALTTKRAILFGVVGLGLGLVALTRAELFIAIGVAVELGILIGPGSPSPASEVFRRPGSAPRIQEQVALLLGFSTPLLITLALLLRHLSLHDAMLGLAGSWPSMFNTRLTSLPFYRRGMGMLDPVKSLQLLTTSSLQWVLWLIPAIAAALLIRPARRSAVVRIAVIGCVILYAMAAASCWRIIASTDFFRPLTVYAAAWSLGALRSWWKRRDVQSVFVVSLVTFASLLLLKMLLYARIHQYGFAVAMPATIVTAVALGVLLPRKLDAFGRCGTLVRASMLTTGVAVAFIYFSISTAMMRTKIIPVGAGSDFFWTDLTRGPDVDRCLSDLARTPPDSTVLVIPEGAMLNYLARRKEPTPYANFNPPDLAIFGDETVLAAIKASPPDYVVVAHKDTSEFGVRLFGRDYGQPIMAWMRDHYRPTRVMGSIPLRDVKQFGIVEMTRMAPTTRP